ncbi:MAG: 2-dehydro-3-deoxygalactonokinase [Clostridia bacterium]|nr:2-dehydro-3-deoxygalactonokinase [Clostridia bacterium]
MSNYITIDGGTSNTRISLVKDYRVCDTVRLAIGARANMENKGTLEKGIRDAICKLTKDNGITENDIEKILASGMITCEFGLCNLPHITTPAGIEELHNTMHEEVFESISSVPVVFIRGVKTECGELSAADMMRGEETELMGIMSDCDGECVYVLPGSHSKIIHTDKDGKITGFSTMLTGEMIFALSQNTILRDAVDLSVSQTDTKYLMMGYEYARDKGINEALFKTRVLKNLFGAEKEQTYSFFIGAVLSAELESIVKSDAQKVVIGGKAQIRNAMAHILSEVTDKHITALDDEIVDASVSMGMIRIFEH